MSFEAQVTDVELVVDTRPRVYLKWKNTEEGRDEDDCYERIEIAKDRFIYINTYNRSQALMEGHPFWDKLEALYQTTVNKPQPTKNTLSWISVEDSLPVTDEPVLGYPPHNPSQFKIILVAHDGEQWREFEDNDPNELYSVGFFNGITHWMPLPPVPLRLDLDMSN
jgi:hypothetical protein